ncbi:hypothetical protein BJ170DRAFT_451390 [Xylariales sp. AK1849]|nr:hypothetical protein BJ170DRAFT_451390 [Xylariales sp. AK1849]
MAEADSSGACFQEAQIGFERIWSSFRTSRKPISSYPPISSIPRTSPERLARASPDNASGCSPTVLYLAYGSNLCANTFLGVRGIRPISSINVSAPAFDLTFDLAGLPYQEPCFANTAPRRIPKLPIPGDPTKPPIELPPPGYNEGILFPALPGRGPTWSKGLYGVVYEVTKEDFSTIVKTEGGGASYKDVQTLCIALPPAIRIPEKPPIPDLKPFLAHTLYAPRLPVDPPTDKWWQKLLTPVRRPEADYAQPSLRYLRLIKDGAAEHYLPQEYQNYLERLESYTITQKRQEVGKWLFMLLWAPMFTFFIGSSRLFADKDGKIPTWLAASMAVMINLAWLSYDGIFKKHFGDGERTMEEDDDEVDRRTIRSRWLYAGDRNLNEKNRLLDDW